MIARFIKIFIGVVVVLIVVSSVWGIIPLEAVLPTAVPLSVVAYIVIAVLKKRGILSESDNVANETTNVKTRQSTSRSASAPKATKAPKPAKPKMPKPKCKWARILYFSEDDTMYCYCKSPQNKVQRFSHYENVSRRNGEFVTGSSSHTGQSGNWWNLCVGGKGGGRTPSKCTLYK